MPSMAAPIPKLSPSRYSQFIDVFGGSGTVTLSRPIQQGCMEVYNDFNGDLTNLFCCVKNRTMALLLELGFLPLNTRDDFNVLYKFFSREEFTDDYLDEEMELTQRYLEPPDAKTIRRMMLERAPRGDVRRAADYFKLIRYSFSGGAKSFAGKSCDIRRFFYLIWECSRRLANVVIENKDYGEIVQQYDRPDAFLYFDPPYYDAEDCYAAVFPKEDHHRLHDALLECKGNVFCLFDSERSPQFCVRNCGLLSIAQRIMALPNSTATGRFHSGAPPCAGTGRPQPSAPAGSLAAPPFRPSAPRYDPPRPRCASDGR